MNTGPAPRILLVEDDPISAKLTTNVLGVLSAEVTHVMSGEEAVALFEAGEKDFDMVLMDLYLKGMTGFVAWDQIRSTDHWRARRIPGIALTSNALMESKADFLKTTRFDEYFTKPVRKETFPDFVLKHLPKMPSTTKLSWY